MSGGLPEPRVASYRRLRDARGEELDRALALWFPGPATATGEDLAELHLHGGRAVVSAVEGALDAMPKLRRATPGEFTRRAFANGRIDLAEAEGLADLLAAETELQRRNAIALSGGALSKQVEGWRADLLTASAMVEAALDFEDEDDVPGLPETFDNSLKALKSEISTWLEFPHARALREGYRVVIAGPPNAGKSTLFNALIDSEAAITSEVAGTTRDVLVQSVALDGVPFQFFDTAGLRDATHDEIEAIGMERAQNIIAEADLVLWLGPEDEGPAGCWEIAPQSDRPERAEKAEARHTISAVTGEGIAALIADLVETARKSMPRPGEVALNERQHRLLAEAAGLIGEAQRERDPLLAAEALRQARAAFDALLGRTTTEDMLDALFGRFCIGK